MTCCDTFDLCCAHSSSATAATSVNTILLLLPLALAASFGTGLTYGGPAVCIWGWLGVSFCMLCVALGMAELSSAYPTSGGMYYWQYRLAGRRTGPFACWLTGEGCSWQEIWRKRSCSRRTSSGRVKRGMFSLCRNCCTAHTLLFGGLKALIVPLAHLMSMNAVMLSNCKHLHEL
jgi:hypothetical protein